MGHHIQHRAWPQPRRFRRFVYRATAGSASRARQHGLDTRRRVIDLAINHLTEGHCLSMLLHRAPNGQQRNTGMISSGEAPSADPAEQPRIVAAAVRIHESAVLNHESVPSVEGKEKQSVATRRLQDPLLVATLSLYQEQDRVFVAWTAYCNDESRMHWWLRNPIGTRIPRIPAHYPSITRWSC